MIKKVFFNLLGFGTFWILSRSFRAVTQPNLELPAIVEGYMKA